MVVLRGKRRLPSSLETVTWEHGGEGKGEGARGWCGFWLTLQGERRRTEENRHAGTTWPWEARGGGKALCRGREGRGEEGASCWDEQPTSGATCRTNCCTACSYRRKVEILVSPLSRRSSRCRSSWPRLPRNCSLALCHVLANPVPAAVVVVGSDGLLEFYSPKLDSKTLPLFSLFFVTLRERWAVPRAARHSVL